MSDHHDIVDVDGYEEPTVAALAPIQPGDALVRSAASVDDIDQAFSDYQTLCRRLLTDDDIQHIRGKSFRKKSAWRKLAVAFGVSCEVRERIYDRNDANGIIRAEVVVRATAPNGRYMDGLGVCDIAERSFSKPNHDIPATAMTRATNRACADLFGMGEVSAEEITDDRHDEPSSGPRARDRVAPQPDVDAETTAWVVEQLKALPDNYRDDFKAWRREQNIPWPIPKNASDATMRTVRDIVARAEKDLEPF